MRDGQRGDGMARMVDDRDRDVDHALDDETVHHFMTALADLSQVRPQAALVRALRQRRPAQHFGQPVLILKRHHHPARGGAPEIDPGAKPDRHDMPRGRIHLPHDQHRIVGQDRQVDRLVDPVRQVAHQRFRRRGQPLDQGRAVGHLEQPRGQPVFL